jgi:hypothetical protein
MITPLSLCCFSFLALLLRSRPSLSFTGADSAATNCRRRGHRAFSFGTFLTMAVKPPIYITIGPQCSGKTTMLSKLQQELMNDPTGTPIHDVALDNQRGVYVPVNCDYFLRRSTDRLLHKRIQGKTIGDRIHGSDNDELRCVLQRCHGLLSERQFQDSIANLYRTYSLEASKVNDSNNSINDYDAIGQELVAAVKDVLAKVEERPPTIQLFIVESLFRPHPQTNMTGVDAAQKELVEKARTTTLPLSWGNTNTRPREYKVALDAAQQSGRQVYFLVYAEKMTTNGVFLPPTSLGILLRRNVKRLLQSGKYVPAKAIVEATERVESLVTMARRELDKTAMAAAGVVDNDDNDDGGGDASLPQYNKLELDVALAKMANYEMRPDRTVRFVPPGRKSQPPPKQRRNTDGWIER